ncbi:hypothetical protein GCM10011517_15570 [Actibacterium pelagium]|uniref:Molybdopterin-guanine dinucleotide biosynthesis protein MobA n=1 Tax=Actibacterium pelagium TaxID=2029103 RepID=A0A917EIY1_9RHOB|nr:DUF3305 domain-containing protein [Actibacterium pelagium]GGE48609.1 hypothetical protein GCM10011517_15570 [Actibacterium pelagium]
MPLGIVIRRSPGVTRWARWSWKATSVLPGAADADWREIRVEGDVTEFHAGTLPLEMHGADAEAYMHGLSAEVPCVYVVLRESDVADKPFEVLLVTASPYEAQDYADNGEDLVEKVPMPEGLVAWVRDFAMAHHEDEEFKKRRRDKKRIDKVEDGIGDERISQISDVYRSPASAKRRRLH